MEGVTLLEVVAAIGGAALLGAVIAALLRSPESAESRGIEERRRIRTAGYEQEFKRPPDESELL